MRHSVQTYTAVAAVIVVILFAFSCDRSKSQKMQSDEIPDGELVFEDDFERTELGDDWQTGYDGWEIVDGALHVEGAKNDALWLQEPLPDQFRVSFTARSESEEGDIKFEILGDGQTHESGYVGIFGGWNNRLNVIARLDEHGDDRLAEEGLKVEPGKDYEMDVVRTDHRLRWYVDGELFLSYSDSDPLRGDGHRHFGFNDWDAPLIFDEVRVYDVAADDE